MDWARAIERNSEALKGIVAGLFAMLEAAGGIAVARVPRPLRIAVLAVLRPAESAVRRKRQVHAIDPVLVECHGLAWDALAPDTS